MGKEHDGAVGKLSDPNQAHQNAEARAESATNSGRGEEEGQSQPGAVSNDGKHTRHSKSFNSNAHRSQMSHFDVI